MRFESIDMIKGIAVVFMIIFHIFYFPNKYGYPEFNYDTKLLNTMAKIAQIIFITGVGLNMYISYKNEEEKKKKNKKAKSEFLKKQLLRTTKLIVLAVFVSIFSYFVFGDMFVKFGILHFMAFSSLLVLPFVDSPKIITGIIGITIFIRYLVSKDRETFSNVNPKFAFITGLYSKYGAVDHFPVTPWIIFICIGLILGRVISDKKNATLLKVIEDKDKKEDKVTLKNGLKKGLKWCGKNSLEIYIVHWILLFLFFAYIYPKLRNIQS